MPNREEMISIMKKLSRGGDQGVSLTKGSEYWSQIKFNDDILTDAVAKHVLGLVYTGMADVGETLQCICDIDKFADDGWAKSWSAMVANCKAKQKLTKARVMRDLLRPPICALRRIGA